MIAVTIPDAWDDRVETGVVGPGIQVGTDVDATQIGSPQPALGIFVYPKNAIVFETVDALLEEVVQLNDLRCIQQPPVDFDHRLFSGRYRILSDCLDGDPELMGMLMVGELTSDDGHFLQVSIITSAPADVAAAETILATLQIDLV